MNERDYKQAVAAGAVCSVTGKPCRCRDSGRCRAYRTSVDNLSNELVQRLKTLKLHLQVCKAAADWCVEYDEGSRQWPQPEVRDVWRKLDVLQGTLEEILEG